MKQLTTPLLINLIGFQLLWPAAVLGAAHGAPQLAWWVLIAMLVLMGLTGADWKRDSGMVLAGFLVCALLEPVWLGGGFISYVDSSSEWVAPGWIWALWGGFSVSFFYCLRWLQQRPILAAVFGGVGGGLSVWMGVRLGAAEAPLGVLTLMLVYGGLWAFIVPLFAALARFLQSRSPRLDDGVGDNV